MEMRILVIEDNPTNLDLMSYLLKAFGHTVLTAMDGELGLGTIRREAPDLVVCDVQIPKLSGYQVAQRLKNHPALRKIPLIAVTALAMVGDRDKLLAAGFDGYIPKPINPETFVPEVETYFHAAHGSTRPRPQAVEPMANWQAGSTAATLLVVDDSPINLSLMQSTLEPFGYHLLYARSATEALLLLRQTTPDVILSDVHMPEADGYALIRAVKADPRWRDIPFLFISSTIWPESDREIGLALGAVKFIGRPIEPGALVAEIEACLQS